MTQPEHDNSATTLKPPLRPIVILGAAIFLPGVGQILNNAAARGLMMVFFMILLGWVTYYTSSPERSFAGRYAGGLFIYAISVLDAYKFARIRTEVFNSAHKST